MIATIFENVFILIVVLVAFGTFLAFGVFCASSAMHLYRKRQGGSAPRARQPRR